MATAEEDLETQELKEILKSLGEGLLSHIEAVKLKEEVDEFVAVKIFQDLFGIELCGSVAEALNCYDPEGAFSFGDYDLTISPAENLIIDDKLIEYLPDNKMHVKIKGADHPVLQSCLVEGTEYVATSALKNLHPALFGNLTHIFFLMISKIFFSLNNSSMDSSPLNARFTNDETSPAIAFNVFHNSSISNSKQYELLKASENVNSSKTNFESTSQREDGKRIKNYSNETAFQFCVAPENCHDLDRKETNQKTASQPNSTWSILCCCWSNDTERSGDGDQDVVAATRQPSALLARESLESSYQGSEETMSKRPVIESEDVEGMSDSNKGGHTTENQNEMKTEQRFLTRQDQLTRKDQPHNSDGTDKENGKTEHNGIRRETISFETEKKLNPFLKHEFGKSPETKKTTVKESEKGKSQQSFAVGIDFVPGFKCQGWPKVALEWTERKRKWPSPDVVDKVIQGGFNLVVKAPKNSGNQECDFRLSFSQAEYLLSQNMNDIQRECYRCLKKFHRAYLSTEPKSLATFHLKNLFLQTIEETGAEMWTESNRVKCMMTLLRNLLEALRKKDLRHFFVRSYNLFCVDYIEDPEILTTLAGIVQQIIQNPMQFAKEMIQKSVDWEEYDDRVSSFLSFSNERNEMLLNLLKGKNMKEKHENLKNMMSSCPGLFPNQDRSYDEVREIFQATCKELTDMAFNEPGDIDPLQSAIVKDLRVLNLNMEHFKPMICRFVQISTDRNTKRAILQCIQRLVAIFKDVENAKYLDKEALFRIWDEHIVPWMWAELVPARSPLYRSYDSQIPPDLRNEWQVIANSMIDTILPREVAFDDLPLD